MNEELTVDVVGRHLHDYYNSQTSNHVFIRHWLFTQKQAEQNKGNHYEKTSRRDYAVSQN